MRPFFVRIPFRSHDRDLSHRKETYEGKHGAKLEGLMAVAICGHGSGGRARQLPTTLLTTYLCNEIWPGVPVPPVPPIHNFARSELTSYHSQHVESLVFMRGPRSEPQTYGLSSFAPGSYAGRLGSGSFKVVILESHELFLIRFLSRCFSPAPLDISPVKTWKWPIWGVKDVVLGLASFLATRSVPRLLLLVSCLVWPAMFSCLHSCRPYYVLSPPQ